HPRGPSQCFVLIKRSDSPCRVPITRRLFDAGGKSPKERSRSVPAAGTRRPPSPGEATTADPGGFGARRPVPSPRSQSFSRGYGSILPTSLAYIVPSTGTGVVHLGDHDAVMSTARGVNGTRSSGFSKGRRGRTDTTRRSTNPCASAVHMEPFPLFGLQSSHLNICYYHQDLHRRPLRRARAPGFAAAAAPSYSSGARHLP
ncbi:unnamed protein product, partial [Prunus brigantina]